MRDIFYIQNKGILTLKDLQNACSPWEILQGLADGRFLSFVTVHSLPLPIKVNFGSVSSPDWRSADYLTKEFWLNVLTLPCLPRGSEPLRVMERLAEEQVLVHCGVKDAFSQGDEIGVDTEHKIAHCPDYPEEKEDMATEYRALHIERKILHIVQMSKLKSTQEDAHATLLLLAICELAEVNALNISFTRPETAPPRSTRASDSAFDTFPTEPTVTLKARPEPYKYLYHSSDVLGTGETIKTHMVRAQHGVNTYDSVKIELYDDKTRRRIHTVNLAPEHFRYCNVAGGKIIKFLPTIAVSADACLSRDDLGKHTITIREEGGQTRQRDGKEVSCFAVGGREAGFLLLQNGRINHVFYRRAHDDYAIELTLNLANGIVELQANEDGFMLLTCNGDILTNMPITAPKEPLVSLDPHSRYPLPKTSLLDDPTEVAVGTHADCLMLRAKSGEKPVILFRSKGKHFEVTRHMSGETKLVER